MSGAHYFQFPLCAITMPGSCSDILTHVISYSLVSAGLKVLKKLSAAEREQKCDRFQLARKFGNSYVFAAHLGSDACNVTLGNAETPCPRVRALPHTLDTFVA